MKKLPKRKPNRLEDYDYDQEGSYFLTICTQGRKRLLSRITVGTPLPGCPSETGRHDRSPRLQLLWHGKIADKYIRQMDAFYSHLSVDKYVIMPDHVHLLISIHETDGHPRRDVPTFL